MPHLFTHHPRADILLPHFSEMHCFFSRKMQIMPRECGQNGCRSPIMRCVPAICDIFKTSTGQGTQWSHTKACPSVSERTCGWMNKLTRTSVEYIAGKDIHRLHSWATDDFSFTLWAPHEIQILITLWHKTQFALLTTALRNATVGKPLMRSSY